MGKRVRDDSDEQVTDDKNPTKRESPKGKSTAPTHQRGPDSKNGKPKGMSTLDFLMQD
jgi:hypothetical protein